ncbi:glycosyltransferase family 90 protein [Lasiosphaeris hirsuta]|uniref:Glycosyltransferase family 90 protein n=1 Tax=Lasiosphaeris hirsuta TaxID=260670 RepID=A0AA40E6J0_9PEZI|nr:glycosyltransferase family 90 protein [Lasiosphaeris hirsuta]
MRSPSFPPRRPSALVRYLIPTVFILACVYYLGGADSLLSPDFGSAGSTARWGTSRTPPAAQLATGTHPIDVLIREAEKSFSSKLSKESRSLSAAAAAYRKRRGRHPPPGFKEWYAFAKERKAVMVEDFWDQIYHDLEPFWALKPARIRKDAWDFEMRISVRDGKASSGSDWFWTKIWLSLIQTIEHLLPDMDLALNAMDEPRLVVPWEQINEYMAAAAKSKSLDDPKSLASQFRRLPQPGEGPGREEETPKKEWEDTEHYWLIARRGCAPDSPTRNVATVTDFDHTPSIASSSTLSHMQDGYVANYTLSTEFCHQPDLQGLNGIFVQPLSVSATKVLFPMFGGSKLAVNNEILLPAPMYWNEEERFMGKSDSELPWKRKANMAIWRGVATGGLNEETNWKAFQRHRFVAMNNGTKLTRAEEHTEPPVNFALPSSTYKLKAQEDGCLGTWVDSWANVSFVDLMCAYKDQRFGCNYTAPFFAVGGSVGMAEQFAYKYLPDIDGNSFSGRYLGFLRSSSLPVKATLWHEWHDSRLVAWKHFVPMDSRFGDWYGIMEYFLGYAGEKGPAPGRDRIAERIALAGKEWAERVLRREDMQIYVFRLLLEYARVSDERREHMGWAEDLV